jgi:hypothetical protein
MLQFRINVGFRSISVYSEVSRCCDAMRASSSQMTGVSNPGLPVHPRCPDEIRHSREHVHSKEARCRDLSAQAHLGALQSTLTSACSKGYPGGSWNTRVAGWPPQDTAGRVTAPHMSVFSSLSSALAGDTGEVMLEAEKAAAGSCRGHAYGARAAVDGVDVDVEPSSSTHDPYTLCSACKMLRLHLTSQPMPSGMIM